MPLLTAPPPIQPPIQPPAEVRPAPPTAAELEDRLLEAYDWGRPLPPEALRGPGAAILRWLRAAATFDPLGPPPANPFPAGAAHREAEALRALLSGPAPRRPRGIQALGLRHSGTALALWRWGQAQVKAGRFAPALRQTWEDRLLAEGPALVRGYALRHALCWALADRDDARFTELRARTPPDLDAILGEFQRLFGLLDGPSPVLRLWRLPGLDYRDLRLDELAARRIWIRPAEEGPLPGLPADTAWIIPSPNGGLPPRSASLPEHLAAEGRALGERLAAEGRAAWFAPSRAAFESLGLAWFPILIELDGRGGLRAIRMGDAAPSRP